MEDTFIRDERPEDGTARGDDPTDRFSGMVLEDRYEIRRPLARGGMGHVYVAWDRRLAVEVAVKFLALRDGSTPPIELQQRFENEAKVLARLRDPHILRPLSWGRTPRGDLFMVTELLSGRTLDAAIREEGVISPARAMRVLTDVCRALVETHGAGVMHRDLKPANLFLQRSRSGRESTLVLDFGIAKVRGDDTPSIDGAPPETVPGVVLGTVAYMSPEQARGRPVTPQSDLYSLGVVMYECLTGVTPFAGETLAVMLAHVSQPPSTFREAAPGVRVPEDVEALVASMMEKEPSKRPQSAAAVLARAEAILAKLPQESGELVAPAETPRAQPPAPVAPARGAGPSKWIALAVVAGALAWIGLDRAGRSTAGGPHTAEVPKTAAATATITATAKPTTTPETARETARETTTEAVPVVAEAAAKKTTPTKPEGAQPVKVNTSAAVTKPESADARVVVASRVGLASTGDNDRALAKVTSSIVPCARGAVLPLDVAIVVLESGQAKAKVQRTDGKPEAQVEACVQAVLTPVRFALAGSMGVVKIRLEK